MKKKTQDRIKKIRGRAIRPRRTAPHGPPHRRSVAHDWIIRLLARRPGRAIETLAGSLVLILRELQDKREFICGLAFELEGRGAA